MAASLPIISHDSAGASCALNAATTPFRGGRHHDGLRLRPRGHIPGDGLRCRAAPAVSTTTTMTRARPGNCSQGLGFPTDCATRRQLYPFAQNSQVGKPLRSRLVRRQQRPRRRSGRSLYRVPPGRPAARWSPKKSSPASNDMQIQLRRATSATTSPTPPHSSKQPPGRQSVPCSSRLPCKAPTPQRFDGQHRQPRPSRAHVHLSNHPEESRPMSRPSKTHRSRTRRRAARRGAGRGPDPARWLPRSSALPPAAARRCRSA